MKRCSKCNVEKELDQFQKYYHSTQKKERIRGYCISCFNEQKRIYRLSLKEEKIVQPVTPEPTPTPIIVTEDKRTCNKCFELKPVSEYYKRGKQGIYHRCKVCELAKDRAEREEYKKLNSGSERVSTKPNTYLDEYQKRDTFLFMQALGYTFNEKNGIWYKEPWKTKDGLFPNITRKKFMIGEALSNEKLKTIYDLIEKGYPRKYIAKELDISLTTICKYLKIKTYE
jgi:hypothetical protein